MTNIATHYSKERIAHQRRQNVACPRCMEPCGWCSDPRWMHGTLNLPGTKRRCTVPGYEPEGADCPVCHGSQRVWMTRTFEAAPKTSSSSGPKSSAPEVTSRSLDDGAGRDPRPRTEAGAKALATGMTPNPSSNGPSK